MPDNDLMALILQVKESLEREMGAMNHKLDQILETQRRQSKLSTADAIAVRGMEASVMAHDAAILEIRERLAKLEQGRQ